LADIALDRVENADQSHQRAVIVWRMAAFARDLLASANH
jgi:hypothetical protein